MPPAVKLGETANTFWLVNALSVVSAISVLVVPEQTPVVVFQSPPVQERTVTVSALFVAGATPSVIRVGVPVEAIESPSDCEPKVPLLVSVM